jgi:hypothetical protein
MKLSHLGSRSRIVNADKSVSLKPPLIKAASYLGRAACSPAHARAEAGSRSQQAAAAPRAVVELLRREDGVTIEQLVGMFNWEPHTARAAISVASKWLGIKVERDESTRAYRLPSPPPEA